MEKKYQVFVSSTYADLQEERKKVMESLLQMNCFPVGMEYFNASDDSQWEVIKNLIDECDYYVLIVAGRYGSIDKDSGISYTQKEYNYAVSIGVPVISFFHDEPESLPSKKTEKDSKAKKQLDDFLKEIKTRLCKPWTSADGLAAQVVLSLNQLIKSKPRTGWIKADQAVSGEASSEILRLRKEIDSLNDKLRQYEENAPLGIDELSQGDDIVELKIKDSYSHLDGFKCTWNELLSILGPHMISECAENELKKALNNEMNIRVKKPTIGLWAITDDSFQVVKVQFIALGLIRESTKTHSAANTNVYWSLTTWGQRLLVQLKAIQKKK